MDEWLNNWLSKWLNTSAMEYHPEIKRNKLLIHIILINVQRSILNLSEKK